MKTDFQEFIPSVVVAGIISFGMGGPVQAERHFGEHERHEFRERAPDVRPPFSGAIHRFHERDLEDWRGGHWVNGFHGAQRAWWWVVGDSWYPYGVPIYPYPDPYLPSGVVGTGTAPPSPSGAVWYYCPSARTYYPYVPSCPEPWQPVPATP